MGATFEPQLSLLPAPVRKGLRAALAAPLGADSHEAVVFALTSVDWPPHTAPIPLPSELSPPQRALAEILAHLPRQRTNGFAIPLDTWNRRRWLGLEPPGVLEEPRSSASALPRWRSLSEPLTTVLNELPLGRRLHALAELGLGAYRFAVIRLDHELSADFYRGIDGAAADEAEHALDFCSSVLDGPDWFAHRGDLPQPAKTALSLAIARSGRSLEERHERFLPFTGGSHTPLVRECVAAITERRRAAAIGRAASQILPAYAEALLLELLVDVPEPAVLEALRATERGGRPRKVIDAKLGQLARQHPSIARLLKGQPSRPETTVLTFRPRPLPAREAIPALLVRQLGPLLRATEDARLDLIELFTVLDADGVHLYDLHLFCGDDGQVFEAGTLNRVASFSQGGATEGSDALIEALDLAYYRFREGQQKQRASRKKKQAAVKKPAKPKKPERASTKKR